jgi:hypothetical protein
MNITELKLQNVKGKSGTYKLSPITAIVGENATAKTTILTAARIALTAKNPLAAKSPLKVTATLDNGKVLVREWKQGKDDSLKAAHKLPDGFPETPLVLLDPLYYLDKSEVERAKYISSLVSSEDVSGDWVVSKVQAIVFESPTREIILEHEALCKEISESDHERHENSQSVQEWLEQLVASMANKFIAAKATVERLKGFSEAQVQMQIGDSNQTPTRSVDSELSAVTEQVGKVKTEIAASTQLASEYKQRQARRAELAKDTELADQSDTIKKLTAEIQSLETEATDFKSRLPDMVTEVNRLRNEANVLDTKIDGERWRLVEFNGKAEKELDHNCLCCGNKGRECAATAKRITEALNAALSCQTVIGELDKQLTRESDAVKVLAAKVKEQEDKERLATQRFSVLPRLRSELRTAEALQSKRDMAVKSLELLPELPAVEPDEAKLKLLGELNEDVARLSAMQKRHAAAQQEEARRVQSLAELTKAEAYFTVIKAVRESVAEAQSELVERMFGRLLKTINQVTDGLMASAVEFNHGEIGRRHETTHEWISHRDFSGLEKAVTYLGIAAALAQDAPVKLVLIDDLIISRQNKHRLVTRAMELIKAGVIHQLLVTDCHTDDYAEFSNHHKDVFSVVEV